MDKTKKLKKSCRLLLLLLVLTMPVLALVSCSGNVSPELGECGKVSFSSAYLETKDLSSVIQHLGKTDLYWRYTAVKKDKGGTQGQTNRVNPSLQPGNIGNSEPVNGVINGSSETWEKGFGTEHIFSVGTWEFTLYGFTSDSATLNEYGYVYKGTIQTEVAASISQPISVNVFPISSETASETPTSGTLDFTGVTCSETLKYKIDDAASWTDVPNDKKVSNVSIGSRAVSIGSSSSGNPASSETIHLTVYRGLETKLTGSV